MSFLYFKTFIGFLDLTGRWSEFVGWHQSLCKSGHTFSLKHSQLVFSVLNNYSLYKLFRITDTRPEHIVFISASYWILVEAMSTFWSHDQKRESIFLPYTSFPRIIFNILLSKSSCRAHCQTYIGLRYSVFTTYFHLNFSFWKASADAISPVSQLPSLCHTLSTLASALWSRQGCFWSSGWVRAPASFHMPDFLQGSALCPFHPPVCTRTAYVNCGTDVSAVRGRMQPSSYERVLSGRTTCMWILDLPPKSHMTLGKVFNFSVTVGYVRRIKWVTHVKRLE